MIYRFAKFALLVAFEVLFGIATVAAIGLWHLSNNPFQINFLTPHLESAFTHLPVGHTVDINRTLLVWNPQSAAVELEARGVAIRDQNDVTYANFPAVTIKLSVRAMARGLVAPTTIELKGLEAGLRRSSTGNYQLAVSEHVMPGNQQTAVVNTGLPARIRALVDKIAAALESEHDPSNPLFYFQTFRLLDGEVSVTDDRTRDTWRIAFRRIELRRAKDSLTGTLHADIKTAVRTTPLRMSYTYRNPSTTSQALHSTVGFDGNADDGRVVTGSTVTLRGTLDALAIDDVVRYWPAQVRPKARRWVVNNIRQGVVDKMTVNAELQLSNLDDNGLLKIGEFSGEFSYSGVHVHYLPPVPPVTEVSGTGQFDQRSLRFRIDKGFSEELELTTAQVDITGLGSASAEVDVRLSLFGAIPAALRLLEHPRFGWALGFDPARTGGGAAIQTRLSFPLRSNLGMRDISVEADANLRHASLRSALLGHDVKHGTLTVSANNDGIHLSGSCEFAAVPLSLDFRHAFASDIPWSKSVAIEVPRIGDAERERLGFKTKGFIKGPMSIGLVATVGHDGRGIVNADLDLNQTQLSIPFMHWYKSKGIQGKAQISVELQRNQPVDEMVFHIEAGTFQAGGAAHFKEMGEAITRVNIDRLRVGESQLSSITIIPQEDRFAVSVETGILDARPLLDPQPQAKPKASSAFSLKARQLEKVYVGDNRYLEDVDLRVERTSSGWKSVKIYARVPRAPSPDGPLTEPASFVLSYGPSESDTYSLWIHTNDAGSTLQTLDVLDGIQGGHLEVLGESRNSPSGSSIRGNLSLDDYALTNAPLTTRLLTAASLTGIVNLLKGDGIAFDQLRAEFLLNDKAMRVQRMRTHGSSLGLTAEGDIDIDEGTIDMQGTLVPLYGINSALGKIPLIGELIVGGEGEGLVGVRYGIEGPTTNPIISVNPVSALTPGFLRNVFGLVEASNNP